MRHQIFGRQLSRTKNERLALFRGLIRSLILKGEIKTTESRAKAIRGLVDKLITKAKQQTLHSRRIIAGFLQDNKAVNKIVDELGPLFQKRPGGFTRIIRTGNRKGDNAPIVKLELVERPTPTEKPKKDDHKINKKK